MTWVGISMKIQKAWRLCALPNALPLSTNVNKQPAKWHNTTKMMLSNQTHPAVLTLQLMRWLAAPRWLQHIPQQHTAVMSSRTLTHAWLKHYFLNNYFLLGFFCLSKGGKHFTRILEHVACQTQSVVSQPQHVVSRHQLTGPTCVFKPMVCKKKKVAGWIRVVD